MILLDLAGISSIYICYLNFLILLGPAANWSHYSSHSKSQEHKSTTQTPQAHLRSLLMSHPLTSLAKAKLLSKRQESLFYPRWEDSTN